jgi:HAMP domain-containing protein
MTFDPGTFGIIEILLAIVLALVGFVARGLSSRLEVLERRIMILDREFAKAQGTHESEARTLFASIEELKSTVRRIEEHLMGDK